MDIDAPTNHAGALIFWAYIVAALASTGVVLNTIRKSYLQNNDRVRIPTALAILAVSSFATLSYHMLNVLILSYQQWTTRHNIPLGALIGSNRTPLHLWQWSITSSLFQDFGKAIVATKPRYLLSSSGLWSTLAVALFMGIEGRRHKVPNLWVFFVLLEILPTSFAQTLFYISFLPSLSQRTRVSGSLRTGHFGMLYRSHMRIVSTLRLRMLKRANGLSIPFLRHVCCLFCRLFCH
jgi:hypothetical protein